MGRMWHSLLLGKWNELFFWLPIEDLVREVILDTLKETSVVGNNDPSRKAGIQTPIEKLLSVLGDEELSAAELMDRLGLSHRPTFRKNHLNPAMEQGLVMMTMPDKPNSRNQKYRRV